MKRNSIKWRYLLRALSQRERILFALVVVLSGIIFLGGKNLPDADARESIDSNLYDQLKVFTDVLAIVERDYVRPVDSKKVVEGAIKGMLTTLDPHSGYLDPDFYQDLQVQTKGEFGGLGIEITIRDGILLVVAPMEGSPAEKAGIRAGDAIVKIEGRFTKEYSLVDAVKKLRGPKGSPIQISVQRQGEKSLVDVVVIRDNIEVKSVRSRNLGDGLGYIRVSQFVERTTDDLKRAITSLNNSSANHELKGLIIDMRNNPGGLLNQAIGVSDLFLTDGIIVYTDGRVEQQKQTFFAHDAGTEPKYPLVVLVNGGSASASEIVAGALKDHGRAIIIGTQTFGKGSVQTITPLNNGGALTLTTALYYTKSGRSLQALGVSPDVNIEAEENVEKPKTDEQGFKISIREGDLPGAISNPTENTSSEKPLNPLKKINQTPDIRRDLTTINPEKESLQTWLKKDRQLAKALEVLKSYNVLKAS